MIYKIINPKGKIEIDNPNGLTINVYSGETITISKSPSDKNGQHKWIFSNTKEVVNETSRNK